MQNQIIEKLNQLFATWCSLKSQEKGASEARSAVEVQMLELYKPTKGTNRIVGVPGLKIAAGETVSYDQAVLAELAKEIDPALFPFKIEYKPDTKGVEWTKANNPDVWKKIMRAISVKPSKPSFSYEEPKDQVA